MYMYIGQENGSVQRVDSHAMHNNGVISSLPLRESHILDELQDGPGVSAEPLLTPAIQLELSHLVLLVRLGGREGGKEAEREEGNRREGRKGGRVLL